MPQIDFATAQIIVEKAMRDNGYGGTLRVGDQTMDLEKAWQNSNPINYQTLRDTIARSVVDALTAISANGTISQGSVTAPNGQVVVTSTDVNINQLPAPPTPIPTPQPNVNINTIDPTKGAARLLDSVTINALTDPIFMTWVVTISAAVNSLSSGAVPVVPTSAEGKISSASSTVRIGD